MNDLARVHGWFNLNAVPILIGEIEGSKSNCPKESMLKTVNVTFDRAHGTSYQLARPKSLCGVACRFSASPALAQKKSATF